MTTPETSDEEMEAGSSVTLTVEGWQRVEYAEPDETWTVRADGSYESPDGQTRSWPLNPPAEEQPREA